MVVWSVVHWAAPMDDHLAEHWVEQMDARKAGKTAVSKDFRRVAHLVCHLAAQKVGPTVARWADLWAGARAL